jgi:mannose-6-phosphate isomerase-like protein (cupin superfamily)
MSSESFVLQPGEARLIDLGGFMMTVKATAESTDGGFTLLEAAEPPHFGPPIHVHRDAAEAFYVIEGEYHIFIEDHESRCPAGVIRIRTSGESTRLPRGGCSKQEAEPLRAAGDDWILR